MAGGRRFLDDLNTSKVFTSELESQMKEERDKKNNKTELKQELKKAAEQMKEMGRNGLGWV